MRRYVDITSLFLFLFLFQLVSSQLPLSQTGAMNKLYDLVKANTNPSPWKSKTANPCSWGGISCSPNKSSITKLSLSGFYVSSPDIVSISCEIDTLQSLDLSNNHFSSIPDGFITGCGKLSEFKLLNFSRNRLVGVLPTFQDFVVLEYLDLSFNYLNGKLDSQLNGLVGLKGLKLSHNMFVGSIPISLGNLIFLEELELCCNSFQGMIPTEIANCGNLTMIDLGSNNLSGSIPDRLGELPKLEILILSSNNLTGEIPQTVFRIKTLSRFAANQNNFRGNIPSVVSRNLRNLDLSFNNLNGSIPLDLLSPSNLQTVDLSENTLDGSVPTNLSPSLFRLRLGSNNLSGTIPISLRNLKNLTYLELENNKLTGSIPPELGLCQNLTLLNLAANNLNGTLPVQLGSLTNLHGLRLQYNNFYGDIPIQITQLKKLERLNISWNSLTGSIPPSISRLQNLANLDLQGNSLSGSIPASIGELNSLLELQLGRNQLSGIITSLPRKLQIALNLSNNNFYGQIPSILSNLDGLEVLDLSNNNFSGEIPDFLAGMEALTQLLLSNNRLSGVVPDFKKYVNVVTTGNKDLKNITSNPSPPLRKSKRKVSVGIVIAAAAGVLSIGVFLVIAVSISRRYYRINDVNSNTGEDIPQPQVVQGNMLTTNGIHRSNIDFSAAMEAVSHSSNVVLKTRFSTFYKTVMPSGKSYFVKKLNWSDKIFQLGSHEKFGEELVVLGKLSNSNVMTPLAYVLTVDCAYLIYEFAEKGTLFDFLLSNNLGNDLEWASRYSIALGVSQGLAFLHGCNSGPILLLDLSSKSIMLKSSKEPLVGEIELYKVIDPTKSTGSLSTIAGSVGYIPPEYAYTMRVTMAGNVYSFGVILLELLTGKPAVFEGTELAKWVVNKSAQQDKLDQILDFRLSRTSLAIKSQMLAILRVALSCVSISPEARPKMKSVPRMLLNAR